MTPKKHGPSATAEAAQDAASSGRIAEAGNGGHDALTFIRKVAQAARAIGFQAGVGGMETAGGILSYLAAHPEHVDAFMANGSTFDLPADWFENGCLTWQAVNGKIVHPAEARAVRAAKAGEA